MLRTINKKTKQAKNASRLLSLPELKYLARQLAAQESNEVEPAMAATSHKKKQGVYTHRKGKQVHNVISDLALLGVLVLLTSIFLSLVH
jgi:hypothetical protein